MEYLGWGMFVGGLVYNVFLSLKYARLRKEYTVIDTLNAGLWATIAELRRELRELRDGPYNRLLARMTAEGKQAGKEGAE